MNVRNKNQLMFTAVECMSLLVFSVDNEGKSSLGHAGSSRQEGYWCGRDHQTEECQ